MSRERNREEETKEDRQPESEEHEDRMQEGESGRRGLKVQKGKKKEEGTTKQFCPDKQYFFYWSSEKRALHARAHRLGFKYTILSAKFANAKLETYFFINSCMTELLLMPLKAEISV